MKTSNVNRLLVSPIVGVFLFASSAFGADVSGRDFWRLEQAVRRLELKVAQLQTNTNTESLNTWVCTLSGMGDHYSASGPTKAIAKDKVFNKCKQTQRGGFFCKRDPKCEQ